MNRKYTTPEAVKSVPFATGQKYGLLTVLSESDRRGKYIRIFQCRCDCGKESKVSKAHLRNGHTTSCGCANFEKKENAIIRMPEYPSWRNMNQRCSNPKDANFRLYGGRGITVCERWVGRGGFNNFIADMGRRPSSKHTIERKDSNGNYEPSNCIWATQKEQARNTSRCVVGHQKAMAIRILKASGFNIAQISRFAGLKYSTTTAVVRPNKPTWS